MIALVDYGLGNIQAFANIYKRLGIEVRAASDPADLHRASKIILPGVGAFDWAMTRLKESGLSEALDEEVLVKKKPVLGVCVGMQMMAQSSEEGILPGLGWIDAEVKKFSHHNGSGKMQLPHMGWNDVESGDSTDIFQNLPENQRYYFLHSYYFAPDKPEEILARTDYHGQFASAVRSGNVFGVQFHPEKSHKDGIQLLKNFAEL